MTMYNYLIIATAKRIKIIYDIPNIEMPTLGDEFMQDNIME